MINNNHIPENRQNRPDIDCILIGVNCSKTLQRCIDSIRVCNYPTEKLHICYVDGGSTDNSIETAERCRGVRVIALHPEYPTPGLGRNAGWKNSSSPLVQFLDSDTILDASWFDKAVRALADPQVGCTMGLRKELYPEYSIYNWIGDLEWNGPIGEADCFGGDVLIRRSALEKTGGYDEDLVGGEDPELSRRIIRAGWHIVRIDALMTKHDLAMNSLKQYFRRAYRSGYGFAAVRAREARAGSSFWKFDVTKIVIKGGGFLSGLTFALLLPVFRPSAVTAIASILVLAGATPLLLSPRLFKVGKFMRENHLNRADAKRYAWHCSLVVLPQLFGIIRFHAGALTNRPLKNRRAALKTGLSTPAT
jgi:glycosyltransferase involved in cell wall biosynthesis